MTIANTSNLYQKTILTLNKTPLNYGILPEEDCCMAECHNPQCGDNIKLFAIFSSKEEKKIEKIMFNGESCAVTRASASLMTENIKDKDITEIKTLFSNFSVLVDNGKHSPQSKEFDLGTLNVFNSLSDFPSRKTCALLPWKALEKITKEFENK